jgi:FkbM family methyltransferase
MDKAAVLRELAEAERLASASKWQRLLARPARYLYAIGFRELLYRLSPKERLTYVTTFFGQSMQVALPAGTDIYLLGAKSHGSEIRLARFMINRLNAGDIFVDVGAHFGYFSLLAAHVVGSTGQVKAVEAARSNHMIAQRNLHGLPQCELFHLAVNASGEAVQFHEFDALHSEYNSMHAEQFEGEAWYQQQDHRRYEVPGLRLADLLEELPAAPQLIKIDVEGAEKEVVAGAQPFLQNQRSTVVMEYLSETRGNASHRSAYEQLLKMGYHCYAIAPSGELAHVPAPEEHLRKQGLDSDNFVFQE